ncbi:MAG: protein kinase [Gemmatimonadaceae bacterium]
MNESLNRLMAGLADRYQIEREIGRGGMATVYLARDLKHRRQVAIKVLDPELAAVLGAERFLREIETAARLSHPHILPLYDSGQVDGMLFYVMPLVDGETLRARLMREQHLPVDEAVRIARQVASALDYAHRRDVVHRDIKPENILLQDGHALVADFGIALAVRAAGGERLTSTGLSLGTPYYMSPEQALGERQIDSRSDIYSLGCVVYEMLAGEPPFVAPTAQGVVARILTDTPRDLRTIRENVSASLDRVIRTALARLPVDRFPTAARFDEALGETAGKHPEARTERLATGEASAETLTELAPRRRRPLTAAVPWMIAVAAIALGAMGWLWPRSTDTRVPGELTTQEFKQVLSEGKALVLDTRPHIEYAIGHIPGAKNVAARPGVPMSIYVSDVAEVRRLVGGDTTRPIVVYCNGPFCPKSKRLADELAIAGHTSIRRYQLGIPVWRAFGEVCEIEADGLRHVLSLDRTAVLIDVRDRGAFAAGSLPAAKNLPRNLVLDGRDVGDIRAAKDDGRLPMHDHNTRVIVVGETPGDARHVAEALAREAFYNVSYFPGTFGEARAALARREPDKTP